MAYRVTPHATTKVAPCELLLKRHIRTRLELLKPSVEHTVTNNQDKQTTKQDYEKQMRLFRPGQRVMIQNYRDATKWVPGQVIKTSGPVSYVVETDSKEIWRRHVDQLRACSLD